MDIGSIHADDNKFTKNVYTTGQFSAPYCKVCDKRNKKSYGVHHISIIVWSQWHQSVVPYFFHLSQTHLGCTRNLAVYRRNRKVCADLKDIVYYYQDLEYTSTTNLEYDVIP